FRFQNLVRTRATCLEGSLNLRLSAGIGLNLALTTTRATILENPGDTSAIGNQVPGTPGFEWNARVDWRRGKWRAHLSLRERGRRYIDAANSTFLLPYRLAEGGLTFPLAKGWLGTLAGKNLTNLNYAELENFPAPGREWFFTIRWVSPAAAKEGAK
ncbi:MAG: TonB-dependent receptor, partial [bacterium]